MSQAANEAEREELLKALPQLRDPVWRLHNLYKIVDKFAVERPFVPTPEQSALIHAVYRLKQKRHAILKARQMGFSTLIALMILDAAYFAENFNAAIIDRTQPDATAKLKGKIKFAFERLGPLQETPTEDNDSALGWANGSHISAGKHARGSTLQFAHISEWGPIAHEDPKRSEEIKTGVLPAAEHGIIIVETTFKGGKGGHLYQLLKTAQETPESQRTPKDFRFWFFPWYLDAGYTLEGDPTAIAPEVRRYLDEKEEELGFRFTPGQRVWYAKTKAEQGIFMFREYPTTPEEAFMAPVEGSIYGDIVSRIRAAGQIRDFIWDRSSPVFAVLDIGWADATSIWLFQIIGRDIHWIWHTRQTRITAAQAWQLIAKTEIPVAGVFLPWDSRSTDAAAGVSYKGEFEKAGAVNVRILPPTREIWAGINAARDLLARSYIHRTYCSAGIESLEAYHTKDSSAGGVVTKEPVHDWASHDADSFRYGCEAIVLGLVKTQQARRVADIAPQFPPGAQVDVDHVREVRRASRGRGEALSGGLKL